jgi:hypothetical protein
MGKQGYGADSESVFFVAQQIMDTTTLFLSMDFSNTAFYRWE